MIRGETLLLITMLMLGEKYLGQVSGSIWEHLSCNPNLKGSLIILKIPINIVAGAFYHRYWL